MVLYPNKLPESERVCSGICTFLTQLENNMQETLNRISYFSGIYLSYSISSGSHSLKIEPYLITPAETGCYAEVGHNNAYGVTHWGVVMMNGMNHLYLTFNENQPPQLALYHICLKLPMYDHPPLLRGIYTCFDYNYNPVARRILFVKYSDSIARDEFMKCKHSKKCTFYTLRFGCSFAAVNTIKPQLL